MQYGFTKCLELLHQYDPSTVVESIHPPPSLDAGWDSRYQQITKEFLEVQHTRINTIRQAEVIEQHIFSSLTVPIVSINPVVPGLPSLSKLIEYPGDPDQLRLLLTERKVNPAGKDMLGYTALHKFSSWDKVDLLEILCPQKINSYYQLEGKRT